MSSSEDDYYDGEGRSGTAQKSKKRRVVQSRACDMCRRRKSDSSQDPGNQCSYCRSHGTECTFFDTARKRGPSRRYVESLETSMAEMERLLRQFCPNESLYKDLCIPVLKKRARQPLNATSNGSVLTSTAAGQSGSPKTTEREDSAVQGAVTPEKMAAGPGDATSSIADHFRRMTLQPSGYRFVGKAGYLMLLSNAEELKHTYIGTVTDRNPSYVNKRTYFWDLKPWERRLIENSSAKYSYSFPDSDLAMELIDLYFAHINLFLPLLHRPTFERSLKEGLHHVDSGFACIFLLVCGIGARYSDDPRVLLEETDSLHSKGWKWFDQVQAVKKSIMAPPTMYDLQFHCLSVQFLLGGASAMAAGSVWTLIGIGIRMAQEVGAHRQKAHGKPPTIEDELWKRAFWALFCWDRTLSAGKGRPCALHEEDFDLEYPIDCDDEYWDHPEPEKCFKQPQNKPSLVSFYISYLKLMKILGLCLRTIYSIDKLHTVIGQVGPQWEAHVSKELDAALDKWLDSVPDHLRWDPTREDPRFFNQSVLLYTSYYHIQILVHRPYIPPLSQLTLEVFPSLAICTHAARACSNIADIQRRRRFTPVAQSNMAIFTAGLVLILAIFGGKRCGLSIDPHKEMADLHKCMETLKNSEVQWVSAGRFWDILSDLVSIGEFPLPESNGLLTNKRGRGSESSTETTSVPELASTMELGTFPRNIAGPKSLSKYQERKNTREQSLSRRSRQPGPSSAESGEQTMLPQACLSRLHAGGSQDQAMMDSIPSPSVFLPPTHNDELAQTPFSFSIPSDTQRPNPPRPRSLSSPMNTVGSLPYRSGIDDTNPIDTRRTLNTSNAPLPRSIAVSSLSLGNSSNPSLQYVPTHHSIHRAQSQPQMNNSPWYGALAEMSTMTKGYDIPPVKLPNEMTVAPGNASLPYSDLYSSFFGLSKRPNASNFASPGSAADASNPAISTPSDTSGLGADYTLPLQQQHSFEPLGPMPDMSGIQQETMDLWNNPHLDMWLNAPTDTILDEWDSFFANVDVSHSLHI